jgi:hypothetical protein
VSKIFGQIGFFEVGSISNFLVMDEQQGCQMVYFQTKNPNLRNFWMVLQWSMLAYFMAIWYILQLFGIFYSHWEYFTAIWYNLQPFGILYVHLEYFLVICYMFPRFGIFVPKKSGNPVEQPKSHCQHF